jgi:hypothetical protein
MRPFDRFFRLGVTVALVAATGCTAVPGVSGSVPTIAAAKPEKAWIAPNAAAGDLLYAADYLSDAVFIFNYTPNSMKFAGYVPLGSAPVAECVDKAQNVWVVTDSRLLLEFAHGGTSPISSIGVSAHSAFGCSVDPTTGDLAVAVETNEIKGAVFIYKHAKGKPVEHDDPANLVADCAYDNRGNLYADRWVDVSDLTIDVLPKGKSTFAYVTTDQTVDVPGAMQANGKYVVVGDEDLGVAYRFIVTPSRATTVDSITLDQETRLGGFFIDRNRIVAMGGDSGGGLLSLYRYPQGGERIRTAHNMGQPVAAAVSRAAKGSL